MMDSDYTGDPRSTSTTSVMARNFLLVIDLYNIIVVVVTISRGSNFSGALKALCYSRGGIWTRIERVFKRSHPSVPKLGAEVVSFSMYALIIRMLKNTLQFEEIVHLRPKDHS